MLGWVGTTALAMGGSNQMIFLITALFVGQGDILGQGSAAVPLLIVGVLLGWAAAPAWTELVLMWPNRVGGISAACAEAFRPYNPVLSALTGTCYWWGWVPTCGLTALLSASAIQQWYFPSLPVEAVAIAHRAVLHRRQPVRRQLVARLAIPIAAGSATLAFLSALIPIFDRRGRLAAGDHLSPDDAVRGLVRRPDVGDGRPLSDRLRRAGLRGRRLPRRRDDRSQPRTCRAPCSPSAVMAGIYFIALPVVWLGVLGPEPLGTDLATVLGPTFAPLLGSFGKAAAIWFIMLNMFHGTHAAAGRRRAHAVAAQRRRAAAALPLAGASSDRLPVGGDAAHRRHARSSSCSWAIPIWMIAAANFTYLISICMPNIAAWLLRRDLPDAPRPYRAPRGTIMLGVVAACVWLLVGDPRLPAVRPADGAVRPGPGLLGRRALRLARDRGPAPRRPAAASRRRCT